MQWLGAFSVAMVGVAMVEDFRQRETQWLACKVQPLHTVARVVSTRHKHSFDPN